MKIECTIKRRNGSRLPFGKTLYHFKPEVPGGPHIAEVHEDHAQVLLDNAPEAYRRHSEERPVPPATKPVEPDASADSQVLQGNDEGEADDPIEDGSSAEPPEEGEDSAEQSAVNAVLQGDAAQPAPAKRRGRPAGSGKKAEGK